MITLKNEFLTASLNEVGAELKSLVFGGKEYNSVHTLNIIE